MIFKKIVQPSTNEKMIWPMIASIAADLEGIIDSDATILSVLHRYRIEKEKLVWHSVYTAILAMDLARHVENLDSSAHEIGGAALLHDAGFLVRTTEGFDTNGFDAINDKKSPEFREHVGKSVELARGIEAPDVVVTMIAQHQGRLDGHGFPPGLSHSTFLRSSQILAIADIFEHEIINVLMEKKDVESDASETNGIPEVFCEYRKAFDSDLLKKMVALIGFYPVGSEVELNNRSICQVVLQNPAFPLRPVVKVIIDGAGNHPEQDKIVDLKQVKILSILRSVARTKS